MVNFKFDQVFLEDLYTNRQSTQNKKASIDLTCLREIGTALHDDDDNELYLKPILQRYVQQAYAKKQDMSPIEIQNYICSYKGDIVTAYEKQVRLGGSGGHVIILGRLRKVTKVDRKSMVTYKGKQISLTEARALEKKLAKEKKEREQQKNKAKTKTHPKKPKTQKSQTPAK